MLVVIIATFAALVATLVVALYVRRAFEASSNLQVLVYVGMAAVVGTVDALWFIPTVVEYFLS